MNATRKIGGVKFTWYGSYWRKGEAKIEAEKLRRKGYKARVTGGVNHWQVFYRTPRSP